MSSRIFRARREGATDARGVAQFHRKSPAGIHGSSNICEAGSPASESKRQGGRKVDRAALPAPNADNTLRDGTFVPPRTPVEERLATMLASLLHLDRVSAEDNFFLLGGHSLLGTQLITRIRDAFGVDLSLHALFDGPTLSQLAGRIQTLLAAKLKAGSENEVLLTTNNEQSHAAYAPPEQT